MLVIGPGLHQVSSQQPTVYEPTSHVQKYGLTET